MFWLWECVCVCVCGERESSCLHVFIYVSVCSGCMFVCPYRVCVHMLMTSDDETTIRPMCWECTHLHARPHSGVFMMHVHTCVGVLYVVGACSCVRIVCVYMLITPARECTFLATCSLKAVHLSGTEPSS